MKNKKYFFCDMDGTLIKEDMLFESSKFLLNSNPLKFIFILLNLWRGIPWVKDKIASKIDVTKLSITLNDDVFHLVGQKQSEGYVCILISGSNQKIVKQVFLQTKIFDSFYASELNINLVGKKKLKKIKQLTSDFEYIGNSYHDIPIWKHANKAYICSSSKKFIERVVSLFPEIIKIKGN